MREHLQLGDAIELLRAANVDATVKQLTACAGGGNNRIYRLDSSAGSFAIKHYFRHPDDLRDRLKAEFDFLSHASTVAPEFVPRPYACDHDQGLALYEYIEGLPITHESIGAPEVNEALAFYLALNQIGTPKGDIAPASEACFSIAEHLALVSARVMNLCEALHASENSTWGDSASAVQDTWQRIVSIVSDKAAKHQMNLETVLGADERCLSPSDFGFHNALRCADGRLRFIDFEYAGQDDPAKTVGDFFQQPAIPVPNRFVTQFSIAIAEICQNPDTTLLRMNLLRPVYAMKWLCIVLNVFLPASLARRQFANPALDVGALQEKQMIKAQVMLELLHHQFLAKETQWLTSI